MRGLGGCRGKKKRAGMGAGRGMQKMSWSKCDYRVTFAQTKGMLACARMRIRSSSLMMHLAMIAPVGYTIISTTQHGRATAGGWTLHISRKKRAGLSVLE